MSASINYHANKTVNFEFIMGGSGHVWIEVTADKEAKLAVFFGSLSTTQVDDLLRGMDQCAHDIMQWNNTRKDNETADAES